jgi:hypothetical protein
MAGLIFMKFGVEFSTTENTNMVLGNDIIAIYQWTQKLFMLPTILVVIWTVWYNIYYKT